MNDLTRPQKHLDLVHIPLFPLPPSANALYASVGRRRVKSKVYIQFIAAARRWMMTNSKVIEESRQLTLETGARRFLHVDTVFYMMRKTIICKDGTPRRNDTSNRLKALHDVLAEIIGIDDCYFFSGSYDKVAVDDERKVGVDITMVISPYEERECNSPT